MSNRKNRKRAVVAGAAAFVAFGAVVASAATLGTITTGTLGASTAAIGSCDDNGVSVDYTTGYDAASGAYQVSGVTVTSISPSCNGKSLALTLSDAKGTALADGKATVASNQGVVKLSKPVSASAIEGVAIVISG